MNPNYTNKQEMKLFTVGLPQMFQHTLDVRSQVTPYFRTTEFSKLMLENSSMVKKLMFAKEDSEVVFLTASGTGAMEAAVMNCFNLQDKLLIVSGGTFGERFETICRIHNIPFESIKLEPDEQLEGRHFEPYEGKAFTGFLVNLHETYTGQLYDIKLIKEFCQRNNLYLIVDAISTFLCDDYNMSENGIDVTIVSSQKGLCLSPGLSLLVLSKRIIENKVKVNQVQSLYFDFKDCLENIKRGQTPFTPCAGILFELHDMLSVVLKQGVKTRINEVYERCKYFRDRISDLPVLLPPFPLSNAITPIRFNKNIAKELFEYLKNEKNITVNPGGPFGKSSIRVAHIGDLSFEDYDILIDEMKLFLHANIRTIR